MLRIRYPLIFFFLITLPFTAYCNFDFNANCLKAYQNIFEFKLNAARQILVSEKKVNPDNAIIPLLENYVDYIYLLTTESKTDFDRLKANKAGRLNQISADDRRSPYYLYAQAEINLQWALVRGRFGEYFNAGLEIKKAYGQLIENQKKFPAFHLNLKGLGLINAVLGSLPDGLLKSTLSTFGIKGNAQEGMNMLEKLAINLPKSDFEPFYEETIFYYAYVLSDVVRSPAAYAKTMRYTARMPDKSILKTYLRAYISSKNAHNDEALAILANRPSGPEYQDFPYLEYLEGVCKLNKLDYTAKNDFERFLSNNKGVNYIKDTNLRLSWIALNAGNINGYRSYISRVKNSGFTYHEKDKQAADEAEESVPNVVLLKSRLLFDGGYYAKALSIMGEHTADDFTSARDKTEYYYRLGRINENLDRNDEAIRSFQKAISTGKSLKYYFAANSALQVGKIYEAQKNYAGAKLFFDTAINMKGHTFEKSIENQAKEGLRRIKR